MPSPLPFIAALCPTFRRPALLANSLALWEAQDYPADRRHLMVYDDDGAYEPQGGASWTLFSVAARHGSLPQKYNALWSLARLAWAADAYLVWEDDDTYLPGYVSAHAACLTAHELSKPARVLSDYPGAIVAESAAGRFHSTLGFRRELIDRVGGWPPTRRADFDQQFIARLSREARSAGDPFDGLPDAELPFVYGWRTGHAHGQSAMRAGDDETWYDRAAALFPPSPRGAHVEPRLDARTRALLADEGSGFRVQGSGTR